MCPHMSFFPLSKDITGGKFGVTTCSGCKGFDGDWFNYDEELLFLMCKRRCLHLLEQAMLDVKDLGCHCFWGWHCYVISFKSGNHSDGKFQLCWVPGFGHPLGHWYRRIKAIHVEIWRTWWCHCHEGQLVILTLIFYSFLHLGALNLLVQLFLTKTIVEISRTVQQDDPVDLDMWHFQVLKMHRCVFEVNSF